MNLCRESGMAQSASRHEICQRLPLPSLRSAPLSLSLSLPLPPSLSLSHTDAKNMDAELKLPVGVRQDARFTGTGTF